MLPYFVDYGILLSAGEVSLREINEVNTCKYLHITLFGY